jgi:hypothetical protein
MHGMGSKRPDLFLSILKRISDKIDRLEFGDGIFLDSCLCRIEGSEFRGI